MSPKSSLTARARLTVSLLGVLLVFLFTPLLILNRTAFARHGVRSLFGRPAETVIQPDGGPARYMLGVGRADITG